MPTLSQLVLGDLDHEVANTRKMLERFPEGRADFTPHDKSSTVGKLAAHITSIPRLGQQILSGPDFDIARPLPPIENPPATASALAAQLDEHYGALKTTLDTMSDEDMRATWTLRRGDHTIMSLPRVAALRTLIVNHIIHHRAQLSMYYRLMGVPVPGMYGPSADEI